VDAKVAQLEALGGTQLRRLEGDGAYAVTMQDPEGNELCIS